MEKYHIAVIDIGKTNKKILIYNQQLIKVDEKTIRIPEMECTIYKLKDHTVVGNDAIIELDGNQENFEMVEIENHKKECLSQLGVTSIEELIKEQE